MSKKVLNDDSPMPFGKFKDRRMEDVPAEYLLWLWEENKDRYKLYAGSRPLTEDQRAIMDYIDDNMEVLKQELKKR